MHLPNPQKHEVSCCSPTICPGTPQSPSAHSGDGTGQWVTTNRIAYQMAGGEAASRRFYPLIGLYDSSDPDVLECQCLLMKFAGIDGVIIDWYGTDDYLDYAVNHANTLLMIQAIKNCGLKYAIMYEDATVPGLISAGKIRASDAVEHGRQMLRWVQSHWFQDESYVKIDGRPVFLVFGSGYYQGDQWDQIFTGLPAKPFLFTESNLRTTGPKAHSIGRSHTMARLECSVRRTGSIRWHRPGAGIYPQHTPALRISTNRPEYISRGVMFQMTAESGTKFC